MPDLHPVLVEVTRGGAVESRHRGAVAVVDSSGRLLASWGAFETPVFPRSAVKPLQALPLVESGAADAHAVSPAELALACASHAGEPAHVQGVASWLHRLGLQADDLVCGAQRPLGEEAAADLLRAGQAPTRLHNNCSGKHAGFLTLARHIGAPTSGYAEPCHPVQRLVRSAIAAMSGYDDTGAVVGIDGCGVPVMAVPLERLAFAFALLATPHRLPRDRATAVRRVVNAMTEHPTLIGGDGRFDTLVVAAAEGGLVVKGGAEGVACAALLDRGIGLALKIEDGAKRAADVAVAALLLRFAAPRGRLRQVLERFVAAPVLDTRGEVVGRTHPASGWPDDRVETDG